MIGMVVVSYMSRISPAHVLCDITNILKNVLKVSYIL